MCSEGGDDFCIYLLDLLTIHSYSMGELETYKIAKVCHEVRQISI